MIIHLEWYRTPSFVSRAPFGENYKAGGGGGGRGGRGGGGLGFFVLDGRAFVTFTL